MKSKRDYYEVLNIGRKATTKEIKRSFRRLAKKFHPDVSHSNKNTKYNDEKFKEINEAYEVLSDKNKRSAYDMFGHSAGANQSTFNKRHQQTGGFGNFNFDDLFGSFNTGFSFDDIFSNLTKTQQKGSQQEDLRRTNQSQVKSYDLNLDFYVLFRGTKINLDIDTKIKCAECNGSGALSNKHLIICRPCGGKGAIIQQIGGFFQTQIECPSCRGHGRKIIRSCRKCKGTGTENKQIKIVHKIPAGILPGTVINKTIDPKNNIVARFEVNYNKSSIFSIDQRFNLVATVQIQFIKALLGGNVKIPNPHTGKMIEITIPKNTVNESMFTVQNVNGIPYQTRDIFGSMYKKYSNYYVKIVVKYPVYSDLTSNDILLLKKASLIQHSRIDVNYRNIFKNEYNKNTKK